MNEKDVWKWILDHFSDDGLANIGKALNLKIPGFRQINPKLKNFNMLRPKLIQEALMPKNLTKLKDFFNTVTEEKSDNAHYRGKDLEELLADIEKEEIAPSVLLSVLLSSDDEVNINNAIEIYTRLKKEGTLEDLEMPANQADEKEQEPDLTSELKEAQEKVTAFEKKLRRSEQKNKSLKAQLISIQTSFDTKKKQWKEEKKELTKEIQALSAENRKTNKEAEAVLSERDTIKTKFNQQQATLKKKDEEISRLNALILKLSTESRREEQQVPFRHNLIRGASDEKSSHITGEENKLNVAVIGDPKNSRVQQYKKFNLNIIEASEVEEGKNKDLFTTVDCIWMLTYRIPRSVQKKIKTIFEDIDIQEFATFIDLENYMKKG